MPPTPNHKIYHTGFPSAVPLRGTNILRLVCCTGYHCIIKPLLLSWNIALHCFHESSVTTVWCMCLFEGRIRTHFGEVADSASVMKNQGGRLKVKGLCEGNRNIFLSHTSRGYVIVGRDVEVYHHAFSHISVCSLKILLLLMLLNSTFAIHSLCMLWISVTLIDLAYNVIII